MPEPIVLAAVAVASLDIPVADPFPDVARDVLEVAFTLDPSLAAGSGIAPPVAVPSYQPKAVRKLVKRLDRDLDALRAMPWRSWDVDDQIDFRYLYAIAETQRQMLTVERLYEHRPAQWLEPVANELIAYASYHPEDPARQDAVLRAIPPMLDEMRDLSLDPTARDVETALGLTDALGAMATARGLPEVAEALTGYAADLRAWHPTRDFAVIGADAYAWRLRHSLLLPWTPEELLALAQVRLAEVDARLAGLPPRGEPVAPTPAQLALAEGLTSASQLALYDGIEEANRAATLRGGWVSIPDAVGPIHARETPEAMIPLTGDGGSMNPPPTFGTSNIGYWNVQHFAPAAPIAERAETIADAQGFLENGMGPYAAHEGFPGHPLQLSIARLNPDPFRSVTMDSVLAEGWGLYAEEVFWQHGGLAQTPAGEAAMLRSWRHRIARVVYDVNIETGRWDLQAGADFQQGKAPGAGVVGEDILRSINWPTQLICYFAGKEQIVALRQEVAARQGTAFDERAFHDALLAEGSIPVVLIRAKLLGEPVPDL
jgi:hypothetical protein